MNQTNLSRLAISVIASFAVSGQLQADEKSPTERISIVSSKIEQPLRQMGTSVSVITEADIANRGYQNVADVLRAEAGITVSNSGGLGKNTTLRIRGEEGYRTRVYIDGVELSDPTTPQVTPIFDDILSGNISSIEILRGPQGLLYGADAGGVLLINSATASSGFKGNVKAEFGRFDSRSISGNVAFGSEQGSIFASVDSVEADGFNAQTSDTSGEDDGYENTTLHVKGTLNISDNLAVTGVLRDVTGDTEFDGCFDSATFAMINQCTSESEYLTGRLSLNYDGDTAQHKLGIAKTEVTRDFYANDLFSFGNDGEIEKVDYLVQIPLDRHQLIAGADIEEETSNNQGISRKQKGYFGEYQAAYNDRFFATLGVRHDDNDTFGSFTSYRLSGAYIIKLGAKNQLKVRSSFGTGFRAPSLFEQDYNNGPFAFGDAAGLQLKEESSEGLDIGIDYYSERFSFSATYFDQTIEDEIIFDNAGFQGYLQSSGESESRGVELGFDSAINQSISFFGNYTYNDTETEAGEPRLRRPKHLTNLGTTVTLLDDTVQLSLQARNARDSFDIGGTPLEDYTVFLLTGHYYLLPSTKLSARVENLFDKEYQEVAGFNTAGRSAYLSFNYQF